MNCDDGNACTVPDACLAGACFGPLLSCDDLDPCTVDACHAGSCEHAAMADCAL